MLCFLPFLPPVSLLFQFSFTFSFTFSSYFSLILSLIFSSLLTSLLRLLQASSSITSLWLIPWKRPLVSLMPRIHWKLRVMHTHMLCPFLPSLFIHFLFLPCPFLDSLAIVNHLYFLSHSHPYSLTLTHSHTHNRIASYLMCSWRGGWSGGQDPERERSGLEGEDSQSSKDWSAVQVTHHTAAQTALVTCHWWWLVMLYVCSCAARAPLLISFRLVPLSLAHALYD